MQNKLLVCSIGCPCSSWLFRFSVLHSNKTVNTIIFKYKTDLIFSIKNVNISNKFNFWNVHGIMNTFRLRAKKGPAPPPLGNFADISYLEENFKPHLLRDVCTLCSGALVSDSLLHMLL